MQRNKIYKKSILAPAVEKHTDNMFTPLSMLRFASHPQRENSTHPKASPEQTTQDSSDDCTYDHLQAVNGQSQDVQATTTSGSLQSGPVYEVCGGPENDDTYSHLTHTRGSMVPAATISATSLGVQTRARNHANRRSTVAITGFGALIYSEPADSVLTDNVPDAGRGISSTSQCASNEISSAGETTTYCQPADCLFGAKYPGATYTTSSTCQCDIYSRPADSLLPKTQVDTGGSSQVDDAVRILARRLMASSDARPVGEGTRISAEDELVLHKNCTGPTSTEKNVYSQPADTLIKSAKWPLHTVR